MKFTILLMIVGLFILNCSDSTVSTIDEGTSSVTAKANVLGTWKITKMTTKVGAGAEVEDESLVEMGGDNYFVISADSMYMVSEMVSPLDPTAGKIKLLIMTQYYTIDETTITVTEEDGTVSNGDYELNGSTLTITNVEADTTETLTLEKSATAISTKGLMTMEAFMMQMLSGNK